jgi:hypothetical protein
VSDDDRAAHAQFVATLGDAPLWSEFVSGDRSR